MTAIELFNLKQSIPSDIGEHLDVLKEMAADNDVVEFGVRAGNSTVAWLAGGATSLLSCDIRVPEELDVFAEAAKSAGVNFRFTQCDTGRLEYIPECDILFIDTLHTGPHLTNELQHAGRVRKFIVMHDTVAFGDAGEGGEPGLSGAIGEFLATHPEWRMHRHYLHCNGLMILNRSGRGTAVLM